MELIQWFCMGILFTLVVQGMAYLSFKIRMPWYGWALVIAGSISILFGIGWAGSALLENVPRSGSMSLMVFCLPGLLLILLSWRLFAVK